MRLSSVLAQTFAGVDFAQYLFVEDSRGRDPVISMRFDGTFITFIYALRRALVTHGYEVEVNVDGLVSVIPAPAPPVYYQGNTNGKPPARDNSGGGQ